jgi:hypothetical protein
MKQHQKLFVPHNIAKAFQQKGFDEPCLAQYAREEFIYPLMFDKNDDPVNVIPAPLYQQVVDWLRVKQNIHVAVSATPIYGNQYGTKVMRIRGSLASGWQPLQGNTYYEAFNKALTDALELIK